MMALTIGLSLTLEGIRERGVGGLGVRSGFFALKFLFLYQFANALAQLFIVC